jgi:hypothetical protein
LVQACAVRLPPPKSNGLASVEGQVKAAAGICSVRISRNRAGIPLLVVVLVQQDRQPDLVQVGSAPDAVVDLPLPDAGRQRRRAQQHRQHPADQHVRPRQSFSTVHLRSNLTRWGPTMMSVRAASNPIGHGGVSFQP